jgi:DNA mismatch repair protein MutL
MVLDDILPVDSYSDLRVIGQVNLTYILCEGRGELVVIDQHAAHERITLYRLASNPQLEIGSSQILLTPITITFTPQRLSALEPNLDVLSKYGIEAETFGGNNLIIRQLPEFLNQTDITPLLQDVADDIANGGGGAPIHQFLQERLAIRACHNSIRAGDKLSLFQMDNLLSELDEVDFGVCAHGRPVAIIIKPSELEKRFHRN